MRVADADRDRTVTLLREHVIAGRLTLDEFSDRMGASPRGHEPGRAGRRHVRPAGDARAPRPRPAVSPRRQRRWHVAVLSGHDTKGRWRISGKTNAVAVMGGCDMDLRRAEIEGPEVVITAFAFWGGIKVIVPEGFDVELVGFSFMGGRSLKLRDVPIIPGSPRIVVRGFAVMGGIDVRSRSSRSGRKTAKAIAESALGVVDALSERSAARAQAASAVPTTAAWHARRGARRFRRRSMRWARATWCRTAPSPSCSRTWSTTPVPPSASATRPRCGGCTSTIASSVRPCSATAGARSRSRATDS